MKSATVEKLGPKCSNGYENTVVALVWFSAFKKKKKKNKNIIPPYCFHMQIFQKSLNQVNAVVAFLIIVLEDTA